MLIAVAVQGIISNKTIQAGLFRGAFFYSEDKIDVKWISWVQPDAEEPDFHIPSAFGKLILC